jgi:ParB-like chromosome segregation protein Spo0J
MTTATMASNVNLELISARNDERIADTGTCDPFDPLYALERLPEISIPVSSLAPAFYLRQAGTDAAHIRLLADAATSTRLPSILVQKGSLRIIDGMHRVEVAKLRGEWNISTRIVDCTDKEALVLAVRSNTLHGLPLSRADRISSAKRILANHPDWSDRAVAGITGLGAKAIASLRNGATSGTPLHLKRLGRDGKRHPIKTGEGRRRAAEYIDAHPDASLRQIARETDVSLGTVHEVRDKLRRDALHAVEDQDRPTAPVANNAANGTAVGRLPVGPSLAPHRDADNVRQLAWPAVSAKLTGDPTLRYTDGGRAFLRWMAVHSMQADEWREFIDAIPQRWLKEVSQIAASMSEEWREFTQQLRSRQEASVESEI